MSQFSQKPVRIRKKSRSPLFASIDRLIRTEAPVRKLEPSYKLRKNIRLSGYGSTRKKESSSGFSFPVPSIAAIAVAAGAVFVILTALKWEDLNIGMPESYAFQPAADNNTEQYTMQYAATGISSLLPALNNTENSRTAETEEPAAETTASAESQKPEIPHELMVTFKWQQYKVEKGDSVSAIAKKFGVSIGAVIASNEISNARRLQEGAVLRVPNIDGIPYSIKSGDSLSKISASFNVPLEVILDVNDIKSDKIRAGETIFVPGARMNDMDLRLSLGELFIYPVQSKYVTSKFGMRKDPISGNLTFHTGIDLRGNTGAAVMAAMDGVVSVVGENWVYGKHIIISHGNGYKTLYAHLNSSSVRQGDRVSRGKKIGEVGNTGYSTGPHLHFSIYDKNGKLVNPLDLIN
jgi:murein DD-endopeptidase MepM/ murein hydrolase activator NlpD